MSLRGTATDFPLRWIPRLLPFVILGLAAVTWRWWLPVAERVVQRTIAVSRSTSHMEDHAQAHPELDHPHDDHAAPQDQMAVLELTPQARRNLGLTSETLRPITLETYWKTLTVPAIVTARPGRTQLQVATPLTGVIMHVHAVEGEAVEPGTVLFEIRLTHEDLVRTQTEFLKTLGELDVERRELARMQQLAQTGAVAGKLLLEREYSVEKLEALREAQEEALRLHGLSDRQVQHLSDDRRLLRQLQVVAPSRDEHTEDELRLSRGELRPVSLLEEADQAAEDAGTLLIIQQLMVHKGQAVAAGETLCTVADYAELFIAGAAFERDADAITRALQNGWPVTAVFEREDGSGIVQGLEFAFVANEVDVESRTLSFFVRLPNEIIRDTTNSDRQRFVVWRYRPGQRLQLRVPVEQWENQIVLPRDAVAREGAEYFVFRENGDRFDRVSVHVRWRDQSSVVIADDGSLFPGDVVARRSAHQMQMALQNRSGGAIDPHAGHNH